MLLLACLFFITTFLYSRISLSFFWRRSQFLQETRLMLQSVCSPRVSQCSIASQCHNTHTHAHTQHTHTQGSIKLHICARCRHTQLKFIFPSYETQLLFLFSSSLPIRGYSHGQEGREMSFQSSYNWHPGRE